VRSKVLIFGASGQVGRALIDAAASAKCEAIGLSHADTDICEEVAVGQAIRRWQPTSIINAAAYTAVDRAESEPSQAFRVNSGGASTLAKAAALFGIPLVHISTDYVFDGQSKTPYTELNPVNPLGVYGRSKEEGERAVRQIAHRHVILRTSWVYSPFGTNFVRNILRLGSERAELRIVNDQIGCPTAAADAAAAIMTIVRTVEREDSERWGTYHFAGADVVTWYGFAKLIFEEAARFGMNVPKLRPITTAEYPMPAPRPAYSALKTEKIECTFGVRPRPSRESLTECLKGCLS
jgi:dTDP-4-dehydrorhamnose reductase